MPRMQATRSRNRRPRERGCRSRETPRRARRWPQQTAPSPRGRLARNPRSPAEKRGLSTGRMPIGRRRRPRTFTKSSTRRCPMPVRIAAANSAKTTTSTSSSRSICPPSPCAENSASTRFSKPADNVSAVGIRCNFRRRRSRPESDRTQCPGRHCLSQQTLRHVLRQNRRLVPDFRSITPITSAPTGSCGPPKDSNRPTSRSKSRSRTPRSSPPMKRGGEKEADPSGSGWSGR